MKSAMENNIAGKRMETGKARLKSEIRRSGESTLRQLLSSN
jgi:hypothetical protein